MIGSLGNPRVAGSAESEPSPTSDKGNLADGPATATVPAHLKDLAEAAREYAKASSSENTRRAYASDWRHYTGWTRRHGLSALPPNAEVIRLYIAACASGAMTGKPGSVATIERRLSR